MKVSTRGEYALRALIILGQRPDERMPISEISEQTLVPISYMEQILLHLKKLGYVKSKRGVQGGYSLRMSADQIVIGEVIRQLEGPLAPMGCVSVTAYDPCPLEKGCLLKPLWALIRDTVAHLLENTTLDDLQQQRVQTVRKESFGIK
ncbi:AsnC family transcriptional regulator [Kroppenstedtia guangzhouensis]|jgi:Rrf2 family protein|uniref:AsnC family transcriptional regulator n=1 Tax=Kroppenstedtia guangzhouensis TaxID=1274356 RepID=A0ABQ1FVT3_9BACL|nr:Rrf2 family transcriptional regulator [Kroppenstedtia guangzhouensis]GGA32140.1 AsnC family transcriptional regulator [Kroppenstedtia guangzhouensis]